MLDRLELLAELTAGHRYSGPRPRVKVLDRVLAALELPSVGERVATAHPSGSRPTCEHLERGVAGIVHDARYCEYCWRRVPQARRPCVRCGRLDHVNRDGLCKPCRAADAIEHLFGPELERRRPDLLPLRAHLQAAKPRYILKTRAVLDKLERAINLQAPLTHDSIDALGTPAATAHVRSLLVAVGVLPVRDEHAANLQHWADVQLFALPHRADQLAVTVFMRWNQARRRRVPHTTVTQAANDKRELRIILAFIAFLNQGSQTVATATQADLDAWMTTAAADAFRIRGFVSWCVRSRTNRDLIPPAKERQTFRIGGTIGAANETALQRALTDPCLDPRLKLAVVLITVYGIRTHRIANLRLRDLSAAGCPRVRLARDWLELPPAVTPWIHSIQATTHRVRGAGERQNVWLFPGYRYGNPVSPSSLAATLRQLGLSPSRAHQASSANIISQVPPVVAARLLGVALSTAADWHGLIVNTRTSMR
ncbi:MAG TPA: hypothetical protein VN133_10670 [Humibacter sp.]|nr:hypothetical protein [Humibacter sp.]